MSDPHRLVILVTTPSGREYRWAADEPLAENQPASLSFDTSIPGGFATCKFVLPRDVVKDYPDEVLFSNVRVAGPGGRVAWEGRIVGLPREQGDTRALTVTAVGWAAHLKDNRGFREIYRDAALSRWDAPISAQRSLNLLTLAGATLLGADSTVAPDDTGSPCLRQQWVADWVASAVPVAEAHYDSAGIPLGSLYYAWKRGANTGGSAPFRWGAFLSDDDTLGSSDATGSLVAAGPGSGTLAATASSRKRAAVQFFYDNNAANSGGLTYQLLWTALVVYGAHGLARRGTEPAAGFTATDIIRDVLARQAPLVKAGSIEETAYVIPQLAYVDPTDAESVILDVNKYELKRWGVWQDRAFDYWTASPGTRTVWEARLSDGAQLQLEGASGDSVTNGVIVQYTDPFGVQRIIGPTGYAPADATSPALLDNTAENPATAAGLRKYVTLQLSFPTDAAGAEQVGAVYLAEQQLPQRRGVVTLSGLVRHPTLGLVPSWMVRAGDFIRVADRPDDVAREITSTSYTHDAKHTVSCAVGGLPPTTEALFERIGVRT